MLCQVVNARPKSLDNFVAAFEVPRKRVESFVKPARQDLLTAVYDIWNVHLNFGFLPDTIEPADALFEDFRIERQVEQHQMMRKLEIASFTADLGADQQPCSPFVREPCGVAISLQ